MLVQPDHAPEQVHPDTLTPPCDEAEFADLVVELVANEAPRLFAVVQEYGQRVDGRIAAWGLAFEDHAEVIEVDHNICLYLPSPECAVSAFTHLPHITAHLTWVNPEARAEQEGDELA